MRSLHIAIDGRELLGKPTGVGRYLSSILGTWSTDPQDPHRYTVIVPEDAGAGVIPFGNRVAVRVAGGRGAGTLWEQTTLSRAARDLRPDVFFAPGYTAPLRLPCPLVLVVHDVSFFAHPEWFRWREGMRRRVMTRASARKARMVVTVSRFSAEEIQRYLDLPRERVVAVPHGIDAPADGPDTSPRPPIALFVGSLFNRRHIPELIDSFAIVAKRLPGARLILVGDNRTMPPVDPMAVAERLGIAHLVEWRRYVTDDERDRLYRESRVFLFLSDYEGFAMTPMEAMARGAAPILLDTPVAREVYGGAARLVALSPDVIAAEIERLMTDEAARTALVEAGRAHLLRFSWPRAAAAVRTVLERAAEP